eukprot:2161756-Rhodomonas_salina.1
MSGTEVLYGANSVSYSITAMHMAERKTLFKELRVLLCGGLLAQYKCPVLAVQMLSTDRVLLPAVEMFSTDRDSLYRCQEVDAMTLTCLRSNN